MKIRNWKKFQHFKNRRPPWIKLYRDILDDLAWHELSPEASKTLVMLWLIASEGEDGQLPDLKTLAFRLHTTEKKLKETLSTLSAWVEQRDISVISERNQNVPSERETETEREVGFSFDEIWTKYPNKDGRKDAERHFKSSVLSLEDFSAISSALENYLSSEKVKKGFIKNGSTWFNNWRDWISNGQTKKEFVI